MKLVIALIQPHKLPDVKKALDAAEVHKMTVSNALGAGEERGLRESYRGVAHESNLLKKVRVEIAVNDAFVKPTVDATSRGRARERSATARSSCSTCPRSSASAPARPGRTRSARPTVSGLAPEQVR
jgi:nitrogen regulatory protein P-II 2